MDRKEYYLRMAVLTAIRSTCNTKVGAIAVKDKRVIMTAYNGSPSGMEHCTDVGCYKINVYDDKTEDKRIEVHEHCIRTIHAEQNIITQCAKNGIKLNGAVIYCTYEPCMECQKLLIASGVKKVYYLNDYKDERLLEEYKEYISLVKNRTRY